MEVVTKIKEELEKFNKKKLELVKQLREDFPAILKPLFDKSDYFKNISWTQYTPYFNDGNECVFGVHNSDIYINGTYEDDLDELDWRIKYYLKGDTDYSNLLQENPKLDISLYNVVEEFKQVLQSIPNDFYRDLFGDHVKVTVHRDGQIEVEEYDHD